MHRGWLPAVQYFREDHFRYKIPDWRNLASWRRENEDRVNSSKDQNTCNITIKDEAIRLELVYGCPAWIIKLTLFN